MQLHELKRICLVSRGYLTKVFIKFIFIWDDYQMHWYPTPIYNDFVPVISGFKAELFKSLIIHIIHWSKSPARGFIQERLQNTGAFLEVLRNI